MRVDDDGRAEDSVHDGVHRAGDEGRDGERDEAYGDELCVVLVCVLAMHCMNVCGFRLDGMGLVGWCTGR